ncbi:MAG TPA: hypothetical protein VLV50_03910 [Stellaceae bacterium]|nr:hypothetical protein [Stellaceae bacterium]
MSALDPAEAIAGVNEAPAEGELLGGGKEVAREMLEPLVALDFAIHVGMRYHAKRRAWFDWLHRVAMVVAALGSSAAVAALYGGLIGAAEGLVIAVAIAAASELAFGFAERGRSAHSLYRRYTALAGTIAEANSVDPDLLRRWEQRRLLIRADCEERLLVLHRICYNLEAEARGYDDTALYRVKPWQRLLADVVSLPPFDPIRHYG